MNVMLRTESFAYITDFDTDKAPDVKVGDTYRFEKENFEIVEVNKNSQQIVLTLKKADESK